LRRLASHAASLHFVSIATSETICFILIACASLCAVFARTIRYSELSPPLRITVRGLGFVFLVQVAFDAFAPFALPPNMVFGDGRHGLFFPYGAALAIISGIGALWRPSFLLPLCLFYASWRGFLPKISGIEPAPTDYLGTLDFGLFLIVGALTTRIITGQQLASRLQGFHQWLLGGDQASNVRRTADNLIWACGVGAHLGSNLWSGVAKMRGCMSCV
jgi:hypothetical protein